MKEFFYASVNERLPKFNSAEELVEFLDQNGYNPNFEQYLSFGLSSEEPKYITQFVHSSGVIDSKLMISKREALEEFRKFVEEHVNNKPCGIVVPEACSRDVAEEFRTIGYIFGIMKEKTK